MESERWERSVRIAWNPPAAVPSSAVTPQEFASKYGSLVWSRKDAPPEVILRTALLQPRFHTLLDACCTFGLETVAAQWRELALEPSCEVKRAEPLVKRMLQNIEEGFRHAAH